MDKFITTHNIGHIVALEKALLKLESSLKELCEVNKKSDLVLINMKQVHKTLNSSK